MATVVGSCIGRDDSQDFNSAHPIEEGKIHSNRLGAFYPAKVGELLDNRYKILTKLGFSEFSTTWLAENTKYDPEKGVQIPHVVCIEIPTLDEDVDDKDDFTNLVKFAIKKNDNNDTLDGVPFLRIALDRFQIKTDAGVHSCHVYEAMREPIRVLRHRLEGHRLEPQMFKLHMYCLLQALDYLHRQCGIIHTDITEDKIMMTMENQKVLEDFLVDCIKQPHLKHVGKADGRETYMTRNDLGNLRGPKLLPVLSNFNSHFTYGHKASGHLSPIQSDPYRAPEVFLGCEWHSSADIWNLGVLMWDLLEGVSLFGPNVGQDGLYDAHHHLAKIVSLLGAPPSTVIFREKAVRDIGVELPDAPEGVFINLNEHWGGPFFDDKDQILHPNLIDEKASLASTVTQLSGAEKEMFLDLASSMLQWVPQARKTAKQLLEHPFFESTAKGWTEGMSKRSSYMKSLLGGKKA
ncbi:kinase domain protein [Nemania sp. FL0916]|nr:kinase domain protein [Nemania sp. FL0916]